MRSDGKPTPGKVAPPSPAISCQIVMHPSTLYWKEAIANVDAEARFLCEDWIAILKETYGYDSGLAIAKEGDRVCGVLPFTVVKSIFTGTRAISLPFFDICRGFSTQSGSIPAIYQKLVEYGKTQRWNYLELRGDIEDLPVETPSLAFYNHTVDLSQGADAAFANLASSNRRAIRKARKDGVQIQISKDETALKNFYELQCITRRRHGLPPQPYHFFKNVHARLIARDRGVIVSAFMDDQPVACSVYLEQGETVHYKYGASDLHFQNVRCNNLVMWSAIEYYAARGLKRLDLGRNSLDAQGLRKYKQSWGSTERKTYYHRLNLKTDSIMQMTDDVYGWHNKVFAHLPNTLTKLAGNLLYRHIA